ncbi:MAG: hypothetical protein WBG69_05750 [Arcobacteraceae bacterium]
MLKKYTPPYITILCVISICNILFSTYFISFLLAGVVFKIFSVSLKKGYNYLLILCIITFLIIENTQGLKLFSLTIISLVVYYVIIPRIKHLFSSDLMSGFLYVLSFYLIFYLMVQIQTSFHLDMLIVFFINFIIDIFIVGFIL